MHKIVFTIFAVMTFLTYYSKSIEEGEKNGNADSKQIISGKNKETTKRRIHENETGERYEKKTGNLKQVISDNNDSAEIAIGNKKLVVLKKSDYDYQLKVYTADAEIADTSVYTGYSPVKIFYNEHFFVMEAGPDEISLVVYDATKNSFKKYKGATNEYSVMSLRVIGEKLYVGYFAFDVQNGAILVLDLSSGKRLFINNVDGEPITSASVKATQKNGEVYIVWNEGFKGQQVYSIEGDGLKKVNIDITDTFENIKLEELFK